MRWSGGSETATSPPARRALCSASPALARTPRPARAARAGRVQQNGGSTTPRPGVQEQSKRRSGRRQGGGGSNKRRSTTPAAGEKAGGRGEQQNRVRLRCGREGDGGREQRNGVSTSGGREGLGTLQAVLLGRWRHAARAVCYKDGPSCRRAQSSKRKRCAQPGPSYSEDPRRAGSPGALAFSGRRLRNPPPRLRASPPHHPLGLESSFPRPASAARARVGARGAFTLAASTCAT